MSKIWEALLPNVTGDFLSILEDRRNPTTEETAKLSALESAASENCQIVLRGMAAFSLALSEAAGEMTESELACAGLLMQYLSHLAADLVCIESSATDYLKGWEGRHVEA